MTVLLWSFGPICPQNFALLKLLPFQAKIPELISEDCLYLNIWTPSLDSASRLPVMFRIHGGGFNCGFSNMYSGESLAARNDVVVVMINYRVGPLGFLCTNDSAATGNYGILDQIEALKWVQQYIVQFGGDPENVTLFGESAGGMSASLLVLSPLAQGLFRRAIAESGNVFCGDIAACAPEKAAKHLFASVPKKFPDGPSAAATGAEVVEFLRKQPAEKLVTVCDEFFAVIDGHVLPTGPQDVYARAAHSQVELMLGCNSDEGHLIFGGIASKFGFNPEMIDVATARKVIGGFVSTFFTVPNAEKVIGAIVGQYLGDVDPNASAEDVYKILVEFLSDVLFVVPTIRTADNHSRTCKTFLYYFRHRPSYAGYPSWMYADHGAEVFFTVDIPDADFKLSEEDKQLSDQMKSYWVNFARTGNPNGDGLTAWPEYNEMSREYAVLQLPVKIDSKLQEQRVDFWLRKLPALMMSSA